MAQTERSGLSDYIVIEVEPGDSLWEIARKYLNDPTKWRELLKYNRIEDPNVIEPGMRLKVPVNLYKKAVGKITEVAGIVELNRGGTWGRASVTDAVMEGDALRTAEDSFANIVLFNGGVFEVFQNSLVVFSRFSVESRKIDAEMVLGRGDLRFTLRGFRL